MKIFLTKGTERTRNQAIHLARVGLHPGSPSGEHPAARQSRSRNPSVQSTNVTKGEATYSRKRNQAPLPTDRGIQRQFFSRDGTYHDVVFHSNTPWIDPYPEADDEPDEMGCTLEPVYYTQRSPTGSVAPGWLGQGSFGRVCLVRCQGDNKLAALKIADLKVCKQKSTEGALKTEISVLRTLQKYPNRFLLRPHLSFEPPIWLSNFHELIIATDFYPGTLHTFRAQPSYITDERLQGLIITELNCGLKHLHSLNIIHGDLKPDNIFIDRDGHCVIGDLGGCVRTSKRPGRLLPVVVPNSDVVHTPGYGAPELFYLSREGEFMYDTAVDYWALGHTMISFNIGGVTSPSECQSGSGQDSREGGNIRNSTIRASEISQANLRKTSCPYHIIEVIRELCRVDPMRRLDGTGLSGYISYNGWDLLLGRFAPFKIASDPIAVVGTLPDYRPTEPSPKGVGANDTPELVHGEYTSISSVMRKY